jgi:hypothetical protein
MVVLDVDMRSLGPATLAPRRCANNMYDRMFVNTTTRLRRCGVPLHRSDR